MKRSLFIALTLTCATPLVAQTEKTETLVQGPIDSGFVVAPDFKFTDVNGDFATLGGGYGGWVVNRKLLLGGGIYTLMNGSSDSMTYGGAVVEYFVNQGSLVNVSVRGLVGGGRATLGSPFENRPFDPFDLDDLRVNLPHFGRGPLNDIFQQFRRRFPDDDFPFLDLERSSDFFVAEPEVDVMLNLTERFRLSLGGGYRFIGGASRLNDRLDGFTANAALKVSFF
jgi:hypothetical protein